LEPEATIVWLVLAGTPWMPRNDIRDAKKQHITHGRELILFVGILPLWVQDLEIDSPSKRHQKIQKCKFVHSGFVEALKF
jgi:hypothetical protein